MDNGTQASASPFHRGEQAIQERFGVREKLEAASRKVIRDRLPDQHREFYAQLSFVLVGTVDSMGRPWASILAGRQGFMSTPDDRTLAIAARPLQGDPLSGTLRPGADVGILGILPESRRRNRISGRIASSGSDGVSIRVGQAFGNCPQYIQARYTEVLPTVDALDQPRPVTRSDRFDEAARAIIGAADTLFIATSYAEEDPASSQGVDVSHRGGRPGYVRIEDDQTFIFPDFAGNFYFNTIGNLVLNPKAGFLFADFETGDLLYMTGSTEIIWEGDLVKSFAGAERLIRFRLDTLIRVEQSLPLRFAFGEYSPMLEHTGTWEQADATLAAERERNTYAEYEIVDIRTESSEISSFHLRKADGGGLATYEPGQFLPIRLAIPGQDEPVLRTYTVSEAPGTDTYRLSIKREGGPALASNHVHDRMMVGDRIEAMAPRGSFVLDRSSKLPVVLLSAGVGITPMIAMANAIINEGRRTRRFRRTYFIHGARNGQVHAFGDHTRRLAEQHESFTAHVRFSHPGTNDQVGSTHDSEGRVDMRLLKDLLRFDDYDFYLCGPPGFMQSLYDGLTSLGVRKKRIRYESFGPATVLRQRSRLENEVDLKPASEPVKVRFATSNTDVTWTPEAGTLLDLAESAGLAPPFSCRSGVCGTCATSIHSGRVHYMDEPTAPVGDGTVLICCSTPRPDRSPRSRARQHAVVLDL